VEREPSRGASDGGGMRDAIGLLDQLAVLETKIDEQTTSQFLGLASNSEVAKLLQICQSGKPAEALSLSKQIIATGVAPAELIRQLQNVARAELLKSLDNNTAYASFYVRALDILHAASAQLAYTANASIPLELALVKIGSNYEARNVVQSKPQNSIAEKPAESTDTDTPKPETAKEPVSKPANQSSDLLALTDKALSNIKEHNNSLYALLRSGGAHIEGNKLIVNCRFAFHQNRIEEHHNRLLIEKNMSKVFDRPIELKCSLDNTPPAKNEETTSETELVSSAMAILGGELVDG